MRRASWILATALAVLGCSSSETPPGGASSGSGGGGGAGGGSPPVLDPSLFDCSAAVPERTSAVPIECATDRGCATRLVSGHRGVGGPIGVIAPENTLAAVRAAIVLGIDYVETDPRPTSDGFLVNLHDPTVDRTTDGTGDAETLTLAEIQALTVDTGELAGDFACERVPTLEEVLALARGRVHVLVDANKTDRVDLLVAAIQATDTVEWAIFDTDSVPKIDEALALEPSLLTMIRVGGAAELDEELAHFSGHPPVIVELSAGAQPDEMVPLVHAAGHRALIDTFGTDLAASFDADASLYGPVFEAGIDIAQTDRPDLVIEHLGR